MRFVGLILVCGAMAMVFTPTLSMAAASLTNRDDKDHKVSVRVGDGSAAEHVLKPGGVLDGICDKGCVVQLNGNPDAEYVLEGDEIVSIEGGRVYYDRVGEPGTGGAEPVRGAGEPNR